MIEEAATGRVVSADGTPIAWFRSGDGPPLVLVHGTTADHTTFRAVTPRFARRHAVFAIDRRGRSASGDTLPYAIEREFEDIAAIVDAVAASTGSAVDVLGHSFGGRCALAATALTASIRRLVLYESAPDHEDESSDPDGAIEQDDRGDLIGRLQSLEAEGRSAEVLRTFMAEAVGSTEEELRAFEAAPFYPARLAAAHTVVRELAAVRAHRGIAEIARRTRIPVLQIVGGASPPHFRRAVATLDALLPNGRVVTMLGQKHAAFHGDPDLFVADVEAFLAERAT